MRHGIVQSNANRQLETVPAVIHLYTGEGKLRENYKVYFEHSGIDRGDDPKLAPCGKLDSVDITSATDPSDDPPAAFLIDVDEITGQKGHKLCGHCLNYHDGFSKEDTPAYQTDFDRSAGEQEPDQSRPVASE